jgi:histone H3/H4
MQSQNTETNTYKQNDLRTNEDESHVDRGLTKPAITRLARRAGVKSMSDECVGPVRNLVAMKLDELLSNAVIVNGQHTTKTIMEDDIYEALAFMNINVARTEEF